MRKHVVLAVLALAFSLIILTQLVVTQVSATVIQASVNVDPDSLLLKEEGYGKWMTAYIRLPEGFDVSSIDASSIIIEVIGVSISVEKHSIQGNTLIVKFDREYVVSLLWSMTAHMSPHAKQEVTFEIKGQLHDGNGFEGSDTVRVFFTQM